MFIFIRSDALSEKTTRKEAERLGEAYFRFDQPDWSTVMRSPAPPSTGVGMAGTLATASVVVASTPAAGAGGAGVAVGVAIPKAATERITFIGHGSISDDGSVKRYGSGPDGDEMHVRGFTPAEFVAELKAKIPDTVHTIDFIGCNIGLGCGSLAPGKISWLAEVAHRIRVDEVLGKQIKMISAPRIPRSPDPSDPYVNLLVRAADEAGDAGYHILLLNSDEKERYSEINKKIAQCREYYDVDRTAEELEMLNTSYGRLKARISALGT